MSAPAPRLPSLRVVLTAAVALPLSAGLLVVGVGVATQAGAIVEQVSTEEHRQLGLRLRAELTPVLEVPHALNAANAELLRTTGPLASSSSLLERQLPSTGPASGPLPDDAMRRHLLRQLRDAPGAGYVQVGYEADGGFVGVERMDDGSWHAEVSDAGRTGKAVWALDPAGDPVGEPLTVVPGYDARTRPWYRAAVAAGAPTWSPIYQFSSRAAPRLGLTAVQPLLDEHGARVGVLGTDLVLSQLSALLDASALGPGAEIALVERDGELVARSSGSPFHVGADGTATRVSAAEDPALDAAVRALADPEGALPELGSDRTFRLADPDQLVFAAPVRDGRGLDWVLLVTVPADRAVGPLRDHVRGAMLAGLALLLVAGGGAVALAAVLTRPLRDVSLAADALSRRRWDHPLPGRPVTREIEALVRGFGVMRAELQAALEDAEQARRVAEDGSRAKSAFLAGVSHELRTPLTAILGYADLLLEEPELADEHRRDLGRLRRAAGDLLGVINELLDLARVESGRLSLTLGPVDVGALVAEVADQLRPVVQANRNRLVLAVEPGLPVLRTDRSRLRQVLVNLVGNAAKFTDDGTVTVRAGRRGDGVRLEVEDTGIGIPPELLGTIFRPFERAPGVEQRVGTGLGLAIVSRLLEAMEGRISVTSEAGRGTRFTVELDEVRGLERPPGPTEPDEGPKRP